MLTVGEVWEEGESCRPQDRTSPRSEPYGEVHHEEVGRSKPVEATEDKVKENESAYFYAYSFVCSYPAGEERKRER